MTAKKIIGARLRSLREEPRDPMGRSRWSREKWAMMLRRAAGPAGQGLPGVESLAKMIQQWERGDHVPGPIYRPLYARLTDKPETELFKEAMLVTNQAREDEAAPLVGTVERSPAPLQEDAMRRRAALQVIAALGTGAALPPGTVETVLSGIEDALGNPLDIAEWQGRVHEYGLQILAQPAGSLVTEVTADIVAVGELLKGPRSASEKADLLRIAAELSGLLAMDLSDKRDDRAARVSWGTARRAADASGDRALMVWVRAKEAQKAVWLGRPAAVTEALAADAIDVAESAPSSGLARAFSAQAYMAAEKGDSAAAKAALWKFKDAFDDLSSEYDNADATGLQEGKMYWSEAYVLCLIGGAQTSAVLDQAEACADGPIWREELELMRALHLVKDREMGAGLGHALSKLHVRPLSSFRRRMVLHILNAVPTEQRTLPEAKELALTVGA